MALDMSRSRKKFESVDPAPTSAVDDLNALRKTVFDTNAKMFGRMEALFGLRALGTDDAIRTIGEVMVTDASALLKHECAFVFGQMRDKRAAPFLVKAIENDESPMVRHEAVEALGALGDRAQVEFLKKVMESDESIEVKESCEVALDNISYLNDDKRV